MSDARVALLKLQPVGAPVTIQNRNSGLWFGEGDDQLTWPGPMSDDD
jgi:hypothetical protein